MYLPYVSRCAKIVDSDLVLKLFLLSEDLVLDEVFFINQHFLKLLLCVAEVSLGGQTVRENCALVVDPRRTALELDRAPMPELLLCEALLEVAVFHSDLSLDLYGNSCQRSLLISEVETCLDLNLTYLPVPSILRDSSVLGGPRELASAPRGSLGRDPHHDRVGVLLSLKDSE